MMKRLFKRFRDGKGGVTSIEYALLAGVMGTGVALSLDYVSSEFKTRFQPVECTWEVSEADVETKQQRCIGAKGWKARRPARQ